MFDPQSSVRPSGSAAAASAATSSRSEEFKAHPAWSYDKSVDEYDFFQDKLATYNLGDVGSWVAANGQDFQYCAKHKRLTEAVMMFDRKMYDENCTRCCTNSYADTFLNRKFSRMNLHQARDAWTEIHKKKPEMMIKAAVHTGDHKAEVCAFGLEERAAWMRYSYLAWDKSMGRELAIRNRTTNPHNYEALPDAEDEDLVDYNRNAGIRRSEAGLTPIKHNVKQCPIHSTAAGGPVTGHAIHTMSKTRYRECGICIHPRQESRNQVLADQLSERSVRTMRAILPSEPRGQYR